MNEVKLSINKISDLPGAVTPNRYDKYSAGYHAGERAHDVDYMLRNRKRFTLSSDEGRDVETPKTAKEMAEIVLTIERFKEEKGLWIEELQNYRNGSQEISLHLRTVTNFEPAILHIVQEYLIGSKDFEEMQNEVQEFNESFMAISNASDGWAGIMHDYEYLKGLLLKNEIAEKVAKAVQTSRNKFPVSRIPEDELVAASKKVAQEQHSLAASIKRSYYNQLGPRPDYSSDEDSNEKLLTDEMRADGFKAVPSRSADRRDPVRKEVYRGINANIANALLIEGNKAGWEVSFQINKKTVDEQSGSVRTSLGGRVWWHTNKNEVPLLVESNQASSAQMYIRVDIIFDKVVLARQKFDLTLRKPLTLEEQLKEQEIMEEITPDMPPRGFEKWINYDYPEFDINGRPKGVKRKAQPLCKPGAPVAVAGSLEKWERWTRIHDNLIFKQIKTGILTPDPTNDLFGAGYVALFIQERLHDRNNFIKS